MKYLLTFLSVLYCMCVQAQTYIQPRSLQVATNKTTNLVFPAPIQSVDRGTEKIIVQQSTGFVLKVKADTAFSDTTNLTVITTDGKLYSFLVSFTASPNALNIDLGAADLLNRDTALIALASKVLQLRNNLHGVRYSSGNVKLSLAGLFSTGDMIAVKLRIENNSSLSFETGGLRCYSGSTSTMRRRPVQVIEITPLLFYPGTALIKERQAIVFALLLPKAALGKGQELQIHLMERNAERTLRLHLNNKHLLRSAIID